MSASASGQPGRTYVKSLASFEDSEHTMLIMYGIFFTALWYDWATTLPQEYQKIWKGKRSMVKYLYLINRYFPLILTIFIFTGFVLNWPTEKCNKYWIGWQASLPTIAAAAAAGLLLLRCYAIWSYDRYILAIVLLCYAGRTAGLTYYASTHVTTLSLPKELTAGPCIPTDTRGTRMIYCLIPIFYDIVVCGLFLFRAFQLRARFPKEGRSLMLETLAQHGCLYLIGIVVITLAHVAFMQLAIRMRLHHFVEYGGAYICNIAEAIFAARLVLATKSASEEQQNSQHQLGSRAYSSGVRTIAINSSREARSQSQQVPLDDIALCEVVNFDNSTGERKEKDMEKEIALGF